MPRIPLNGGAYVSRSIIAANQRQVNLYSEKNPEEAPSSYTLYPRPGLRVLATPTPGRARGMFLASNNVLYAVVGQRVYSISPTWVYTLLGTMAQNLTTPVSMSDNSLTMMIVDGTGDGYTVNLLTGAFASFSAPGFYGADRIDFVDTFFILNKPGTGIFYTSLALSTTFDPTYFATKIGYPDHLVSVLVLHREIWLIGSVTTEIWVNGGGVNFPFEIMTGAFIQHGCAAKYSVATMGDSLFWLSQDLQGKGVVLQGGGYQAKRISTHAIEAAIAKYTTISDAVGFCYQQEGHQFYVLTFPTADATWVVDLSTGEWHEWNWIDGQGVEHRSRVGCVAAAYGLNVAADWQTGQLYAMDLNVYTDAGSPIVYRRDFPHMTKDGNRVQYLQFIADMEVGNDPGSSDVVLYLRSAAYWQPGQLSDVVGSRWSAAYWQPGQLSDVVGSPPMLYLRWSDDKGASWSNPIGTSLGNVGDFLNSLQFQRLGMARDRIFSLFWSSPVRTALNGAFLVSRVLGS